MAFKQENFGIIHYSKNGSFYKYRVPPTDDIATMTDVNGATTYFDATEPLANLLAGDLIFITESPGKFTILVVVSNDGTNIVTKAAETLA